MRQAFAVISIDLSKDGIFYKESLPCQLLNILLTCLSKKNWEPWGPFCIVIMSIN